MVSGSCHDVHPGDLDPNPIEGPLASALHPVDLGVLGPKLVDLVLALCLPDPEAVLLSLTLPLYLSLCVEKMMSLAL